MPPSAVSALALHVAGLVSGRPAAREAIARAVFDEDAGGLARLLSALGLAATSERVEQLLAEPGPFLPALTGWT